MKKPLNKILIIDDDIITAILHKRLLEGLEIAEEVKYITDPYHALEYVHQQYANATHSAPGPDLIFLDINMPGMNGFEFLKELEPLDIDRSRVSIMMLTTSPYIKDRETAASFGDKLKGYLIKPLAKETVEKILIDFA